MKQKRYPKHINIAISEDLKLLLEKSSENEKLSIAEFARAAIEEKIRRCKR